MKYITGFFFSAQCAVITADFIAVRPKKKKEEAILLESGGFALTAPILNLTGMFEQELNAE